MTQTKQTTINKVSLAGVLLGGLVMFNDRLMSILGVIPAFMTNSVVVYLVGIVTGFLIREGLVRYANK